MTDSRQARPSTDEETAPLLQDTSHPDENAHEHERGGLLSGIAKLVHEPLTPLTQLLLIIAIFFLLLSSIFIGLFAGAQYKLDSGDGRKPPPTTVTVTATTIQTTTSTSVSTSTLSPPVPVPTSPPEEVTCLSPQCIVLASEVLTSLDTTEDPCENFYDFATAGWRKSHPVPADKGRYGSFDALAVQNKQILQQILSSDTLPLSLNSLASPEEQLFKKLHDLYSSCLNEEQLDELSSEPLLHVTRTIKHLFRGESTVVDASKDDEVEFRDRLTATVSYIHSRDIDGLFSVDIEGDVGTDPNFMTLWFSQPDLGLPSKEYYEEESIVMLYREVLERLLIATDEDEDDLQGKETQNEETPVLRVHEERLRVWPPWPWPPWGGDDDGDDKPKLNKTERAHQFAKNIIKFEKKIANASLDLDVLYQDPIATYHPVPFSNLSESLPQIDIPTYMGTFAARNFPSTVILTSTTFPSSLADILNATSASTLEAYLVTRAALQLSPHLGLQTEEWQAVRSLQEALQGLKKGAVGDRSEYCVGRVESAMGFGAGRYFVKQTFGGESREKGTKIITDIVDAFKRSLPHISWMDKESATAASEKATAIRVKVGFPLSPDTRNPGSLLSYYSRITILPDAFFENMLSARMSDVYLKWNELGKRRNPEAWEMYPSMVNAYFNPPANEIVFPAGILQPPFFSQDWPNYVAYGAFGAVAAHELTHAFDSAGRQYNQEGKLEEWWTNTTSEGFQVRQDCIIKQYSEYTIDDGKGGKIHVNGNLTSGENIGDSGLIQAYRAWKAQYHASYESGTEFLLPGLNYTRDQLFFISFARVWASNIKPAAAVALVRTDPHSPAQYRADGTVFNIPEFAKAFNCPANAKLNPPPEKRCVFW